MTDKDAANITPVGGAVRSSHTSTHVHTYPKRRAPRRILVVEDDHALAQVEARILTAHGYAVVIVHTGEQAIATLHDFIPDLVVLDLELHGTVNGWDVLDALRTLPPSPGPIPVLVTTSTVTEIRKHIRDQGESRLTLDHLPKPYLMQTLLKRIERMM